MKEGTTHDMLEVSSKNLDRAMARARRIKNLSVWLCAHSEICDDHCRGSRSTGTTPQEYFDFGWSMHLHDAAWQYPLTLDWEDCKKYILQILTTHKSRLKAQA